MDGLTEGDHTLHLRHHEEEYAKLDRQLQHEQDPQVKEAVLNALRACAAHWNQHRVAKYKPPLPEKEKLVKKADAERLAGELAAEVKKAVPAFEESKHPRLPAGTPTEGSRHAGEFTASSGDAKTMEELVSGGVKELGPARILAWRVGEISDPHGRGCFFGSSPKSVECYASGHEGYATQGYIVSTKKTAVFKDQFEAYQEVFGRQLDTWALEKKHGFKMDTPTAWSMLEAKLMARLRAKGYDSVIFTSPPLPAQIELAVISGNPRAAVVTNGPINKPEAPVVAASGEPLTWKQNFSSGNKAVTTTGFYLAGHGGSTAFFRNPDEEMEHLGFHADLESAMKVAEAHHLSRELVKALGEQAAPPTGPEAIEDYLTLLYQGAQGKMTPDGKAGAVIPFQGLRVRIENPAGSARKGTDPDGGEWETTLRWAYGEIEGTKGVDSDPVDCFLGEDPLAPAAYVIHAHDIKKVGAWPGGCCPLCGEIPQNCGHDFDEDKVCLGFRGEEEAVTAFLLSYDDDCHLGPVTSLPVSELGAHLSACRGKILKSALAAQIAGPTLAEPPGGWSYEAVMKALPITHHIHHPLLKIQPDGMIHIKPPFVKHDFESALYSTLPVDDLKFIPSKGHWAVHPKHIHAVSSILHTYWDPAKHPKDAHGQFIEVPHAPPAAPQAGKAKLEWNTTGSGDMQAITPQGSYHATAKGSAAFFPVGGGYETLGSHSGTLAAQAAAEAHYAKASAAQQAPAAEQFGPFTIHPKGDSVLAKNSHGEVVGIKETVAEIKSYLKNVYPELVPQETEAPAAAPIPAEATETTENPPAPPDGSEYPKGAHPLHGPVSAGMAYLAAHHADKFKSSGFVTGVGALAQQGKPLSHKQVEAGYKVLKHNEDLLPNEIFDPLFEATKQKLLKEAGEAGPPAAPASYQVPPKVGDNAKVTIGPYAGIVGEVADYEGGMFSVDFPNGQHGKYYLSEMELADPPVSVPEPEPLLTIPPDMNHAVLKGLTPEQIDPTWTDESVSSRPMSYGGIIVSEDGLVLVRRPTGGYGGAAWTFAKGQIDPGEHPVDAALREVEQESGHAGQIVGTVPGTHEGTGGVSRYFLMRSTGYDPAKMDSETEEVKWVTPEEAKYLITESAPKVMKRDLTVLDAAVKALDGKGVFASEGDPYTNQDLGQHLENVIEGFQGGESTAGLLKFAEENGAVNPAQFVDTLRWLRDHGKIHYDDDEKVWKAGKKPPPSQKPLKWVAGPPGYAMAHAPHGTYFQKGDTVHYAPKGKDAEVLSHYHPDSADAKLAAEQHHQAQPLNPTPFQKAVEPEVVIFGPSPLEGPLKEFLDQPSYGEVMFL